MTLRAPPPLFVSVGLRSRSVLLSTELVSRIGGVDGLEAALRTNRVSGISGATAELEARALHFGVNSIPSKPPASFSELIWEALQDMTLRMLVVSGTISLVLGLAEEGSGWIEVGAVTAVLPFV